MVNFAKGSDDWIDFPLSRANRHGLIAGATGTGKTVTLQSIVQEFSLQGVPVFVTDIKGDLSGLATLGEPGGWQEDAIQALGLEFSSVALPSRIWDLKGKKGIPLRTTITEMGPLLLSRLLDLNETQEGVLNVCFRAADEAGLALIDLEDLQSFLKYAAENDKEISAEFGKISDASLGAIQRSLLSLEKEGAKTFFGEPALRLGDLIARSPEGQGIVNILAADQVMTAPRVYSAFLLWLLSELFEQLPEAGDLEKPKFALFFDEAHLMFTDSPKALVEKVEQVVRLIRSKGVGVYFITQSPLDIPESVLGQLGHRVQHALRAYTPKDQKTIRAVAQTFRNDRGDDLQTIVKELGIGQALVSFLDEKGVPGHAEVAKILPPRTRVGPLTSAERTQVVEQSDLFLQYKEVLNRESAAEKLKQKIEEVETSEPESIKSKGRQPQSVATSFAKSAARAIGSELGRQVIRGIMGGLFGKGKRRR